MQTHQIITLITGQPWKAKPLQKGQIITLKYPGKCRQCKRKLYPGDKAKWYKKGVIYGLHCHNGNDSQDATVMDGEDFVKLFTK